MHGYSKACDDPIQMREVLRGLICQMRARGLIRYQERATQQTLAVGATAAGLAVSSRWLRA